MINDEAIADRILELVAEEAWDKIALLFADLHPADIADVIERAPEADHERLFDAVADDDKHAVLTELDSPVESDVLDGLDDSSVSKILEQAPPDDAADILGDMPDDRSEHVLEIMPDEESDDIRELLQYDPDTAGGIMTPDVLAMSKDKSVAEALDAIAFMEEDDEPVYNVNVVDKEEKLVGFVTIWELLRQRDRKRPIGEMANTDFIAATTDTDQEEVTHLMSRYDLNVIPVVDAEGKLVGRVTSDDAIEVMEEEASEDIFRLAGSDDSELENMSIPRTCLVRLPWLLVTLFGGFVVSLILRRFHAYITGQSDIDVHTLALAAFVPSVLAMGGNAAIQSSTLVVRSIALGELEGRSMLRLLGREISIGAIMGCFCGIIIGLWANLVTSEPAIGATAAIVLRPYQLALIVAVALFCAMSFATVFGASVPIILNRANIDPAVASGPFVTIANDISSVLIYFAATVLLVGFFAT